MREEQLGDATEDRRKAVLKAFAEVENRRRNLEKREASQKKRETDQHEEAQQKVHSLFKLSLIELSLSKMPARW